MYPSGLELTTPTILEIEYNKISIMISISLRKITVEKDTWFEIPV